jgi:hypothetical protein
MSSDTTSGETPDRRGQPRQRVEDYLPVEISRGTVVDDLLSPPVPAFLRDVSAIGMGFFAPLALPVEPYDTVTVRFEGRSSPVRLRRVEDGVDGWQFCGAVFLDSRPDILPPLEVRLNAGNPFAGALPVLGHDISVLDGFTAAD